MGLRIFNVIIWTVVGIINLSSKEIDKSQYTIIWIVLMMYLIEKCFVG